MAFRPPLQAWLTLLGGVLVHLTLGTLYCFGNVSPYLTSYMRAHGHSDTRYGDTDWIMSLRFVGMSLSMYFGGRLEHRIGARWTCLLGGSLLSTGVATSYFFAASLPGLMLLYGLLFGLGAGLAYTSPMICAMRWFPHQRGMVNGVVVGGFGGGAFVFDFVQTAVVNPNNAKAALKPYGGDEKYFRGDQVERFPQLLLILGGVYLVMQLVGCALLRDPPADYQPPAAAPLPVADEEAPLLSKGALQHSSTEAAAGGGGGGGEKEEQVVVQMVEPSTPELSPSMLLRDRRFWGLWLFFVLAQQIVVFVTSSFKQFGQTFISNDSFLSAAAAVSSLCNAAGRVLWGLLVDRIGYYRALRIFALLGCVLLAGLSLAPTIGGEAFFFIWLCLVLGGGVAGLFAIMPTACVATFGQRYAGPNYGLIFSAGLPGSVAGSFVNSAFKDAFGWTGAILLMASCYLFALLALELLYKPQPVGVKPLLGCCAGESAQQHTDDK